MTHIERERDGRHIHGKDIVNHVLREKTNKKEKWKDTKIIDKTNLGCVWNFYL
jgi:hypothetical protein